MHFPLLADIVIILGLAVITVLVFYRFKLPTVLGFLITGIIAGPFGLSLIKASNAVEILAEVGIILLLFIIGLEFSLKTLSTIKKSVFLGGSIQVGATILIVALFALIFDFKWEEALFLGFLFSLSSTAIVLKILQQKNELNSPHGKFILAVLVFQDIIVVPMMLFTPLISGQSGNVINDLLILTVKVIFIIAFVLVSARYLIPKLLYLVVKTRSEELFILSIVVICFATAWLTSTLGLSLALGAFMAGLIISESEYNYQATGHIIPFREIFSSFFFVSIGMLLDVQFLIKNLHIIIFFSLITLIIKTSIAAVAALVVKYPIRTSLLAGLSIFQVGEFAFILSKVGLDANILSADIYQYFLAISILTMAITPFIIQKNHKITSFLISGLLTSKSQRTFVPNPTGTASLNDHVIIIGYGLNGKNLANAAKKAGIPYTIVEMNAETVVKEKQKGEPIIFGDAARPNILHHVDVLNARVVVVAISDPKSTKQIVVNIRQINAKVHIIVRARFIQEIDEYFVLGANEVIPEEFETSIEIFTRVLNKYLIPRNVIEDFTQSIRSDNYDMLRHPAAVYPVDKTISSEIPEVEMASLSVLNNKKDIVGKSLFDSKLREFYHINVVAIRRSNSFITNIKGETKVSFGDTLYVFGKPEDIQKLGEKLKA